MPRKDTGGTSTRTQQRPWQRHSDLDDRFHASSQRASFRGESPHATGGDTSSPVAWQKAEASPATLPQPSSVSFLPSLVTIPLVTCLRFAVSPGAAPEQQQET